MPPSGFFSATFSVFLSTLFVPFRREEKDMPLKRIEARLKLLRDINKAIKEAREAGVHNPVELVKGVLDSRRKYKRFKQEIK